MDGSLPSAHGRGQRVGGACYKARVCNSPRAPMSPSSAAGFAGCATAWALARRGVASVVLEREAELGRFASGRGAGLGRQLAEDDATTALTIDGAAWLRGELAAAWTPTGGVLGFDDRAHAEAYRARAARFGLGLEVIDRATALARWPALGRARAGDRAVGPDRRRDRRPRPARPARGRRDHRPRRRGRARRGPPGGGARSRPGAARSRRGWSSTRGAPGPARPRAARRSRSYKRHLFVVEATPDAGAPFLWHLGAGELYVRAEGGATLASPCDETREPAGDARPDADGEARLRALLGAAAPGWQARPIVRRWACQRSFTPDRQMRLGRDPRRPWLVWAAALGGHGATAAAAVGEVVAAAAVEALGAT